MPDENGCFAYGEKETEYLKKKDNQEYHGLIKKLDLRK